MCLKFIDAIAEAWQKVGGPWQPLSPHLEKNFTMLRDGWRRARLELASLEHELQQQAETEAEWKKEFLNQVNLRQYLKYVNSATKALELATAGLAQRSPLADKVVDLCGPQHIPAKKTTAKRVRFNESTKSTTGRNQAMFHRTSDIYSPGAYAAAPSSELEDRSWMTNSWVSTCQLKTLLTSDLKAFNAFQHLSLVPDIFPPDCSSACMLDDRVQSEMKELLKLKYEEMPKRKRRGYRTNAKKADGLVVLVGETGSIADVLFAHLELDRE
ncbi:hypothetical protein BDV96DRAFT_645840 [Lophiotrema nucula]|uniref:Uncharacterized protein n=1 Tax=Lophiotrema nucula TaxID=690887 RepID=A0A6A5ZB80_9PLEO|nr:hypothetical protein BDV96DRAFT_645840 [Lophiotrema nucula]